jgi:hypothetical protein
MENWKKNQLLFLSRFRLCHLPDQPCKCNQALKSSLIPISVQVFQKLKPEKRGRQFEAVSAIRAGQTTSIVDQTKFKLNLAERQTASALDETTKGRKCP